jgi:hypothetical protein
MAADKTVDLDVDAHLVDLLTQIQEKIAAKEALLTALVGERRTVLEKFDEQHRKASLKFEAERLALRDEIKTLKRSRGKLCEATGIKVAQVAGEADEAGEGQ